MARLNAFLFLTCILSVACSADEVAKSSPDSKSKSNYQDFDFEVEVVSNEVQAITHPLEIRGVNADSQVRCFVKIVNGSDKPLTLNRVEVSCACTDAQVPQETIQPQGSVYSKFIFPAIKLADRGGMSIVMYTEGAVSRVNLIFAGSVSNITKFQNNVVTLEYDYENFIGENSDKLADFLLPLVVSPDVSANELTFEFDPALPIAKHKFVDQDGMLQLKISVDTTEVDPNGTSGEIRLSKKGGSSVAIPCYIRQSSRISISPSSLSFADEKAVTAFLRIKPSKDQNSKEEITLYKISDLTNRFDVYFKRIANGIFRLTLEAKKESKVIDDSRGIQLEFVTSQGAYQKHLGVSH